MGYSWEDLYLGRWEEDMDQIEIKYQKTLFGFERFVLNVSEPPINGDNWVLEIRNNCLIVRIKGHEKAMVLEHQKRLNLDEMIKCVYYRVEELLKGYEK